jgi:hypothetical protein
MEEGRRGGRRRKIWERSKVERTKGDECTIRING